MFLIESEAGRQTLLRLNAAHPVYAAHFPGNPITPGVCLVQVLGELLQRQTGHALELSKIVNMKFVSPLTPAETPLLTVDFASVTTAGDSIHAKGTITANDQIATKFSLIWLIS